MWNTLQKVVLTPSPIRTAALKVVSRLQVGSYSRRLALGAVDRPHYGYCVYHSARLAQKLGIPRISVLELGVAGGNGLVNLERHALEVSQETGIEIDVYGFDSGQGLPPPEDYRDIPYIWKAGDFRMDVSALRRRLQRAELVLGSIRDTVAEFLNRRPAPIAALMLDLDYYSSTVDGLKFFDAPPERYLPRVSCYFDDIIGDELSAFNDYTGQRRAIAEFNESHERKKLSFSPHLLASRTPIHWHRQILTMHDFDHPLYDQYIGAEQTQLPLQP